MNLERGATPERACNVPRSSHHICTPYWFGWLELMDRPVKIKDKEEENGRNWGGGGGEIIDLYLKVFIFFVSYVLM